MTARKRPLLGDQASGSHIGHQEVADARVSGPVRMGVDQRAVELATVAKYAGHVSHIAGFVAGQQVGGSLRNARPPHAQARMKSVVARDFGIGEGQAAVDVEAVGRHVSPLQRQRQTGGAHASMFWTLTMLVTFVIMVMLGTTLTFVCEHSASAVRS